jgi:Ca2+/Na+ antiporter
MRTIQMQIFFATFTIVVMIITYNQEDEIMKIIGTILYVLAYFIFCILSFKKTP